VIGAVVLAVAAAVAAGAFVVSNAGGGKQARRPPATVAPATQPAPGGEQPPPGGQTEVETSSTATQTTTSPPPAEPLAALDGYWADIGAHNFADAYARLMPGAVEMTESQFIASERGAHISRVKFDGRVSSSSVSSATVDVVSLVTHDAQFGCRAWSGSYEMTYDERGWQIAHANLSPHPCSG
jgi:hypothetical protein